MSKGLVIYSFVGVALTCGLFALDGRRGAQGAVAAWLLCMMPLLVSWVANNGRIRKTSVKHNRLGFLAGTMPRMAWTLGGAVVAYVLAADELGLGFWAAVLVCYQTALLLAARQAIEQP